MSLLVPEYPLFGGVAKVPCEINIRNIYQDKVDGKYTLSGECRLTHNEEFVDRIMMEDESDEPHLDSWGKILTLLKSHLENKKIVYKQGVIKK